MKRVHTLEERTQRLPKFHGICMTHFSTHLGKGLEDPHATTWVRKLAVAPFCAHRSQLILALGKAFISWKRWTMWSTHLPPSRNSPRSWWKSPMSWTSRGPLCGASEEKDRFDRGTSQYTRLPIGYTNGPIGTIEKVALQHEWCVSCRARTLGHGSKPIYDFWSFGEMNIHRCLKTKVLLGFWHISIF